jgi:hypothetical protein
MHDEFVKRISTGIDEACKKGAELVRIFLTRPDEFGTGFAGVTFDRLEPNDSNRWHTADLLAVTLLDVGVRPQGVRTLLELRAEEFNERLLSISPNAELWSQDEAAVNGELEKARQLHKELLKLSGIGPVTASKLLARKRPKLVPISDRVIQRMLKLKAKDPFWQPLRTALMKPGAIAGIRAMRPNSFQDLSELRILDIALWMLGSNSTAARAARHEVGFK